MDRFMIISSDGHAGALPETYREYLEAGFRDDYDAWVAEKVAGSAQFAAEKFLRDDVRNEATRVERTEMMHDDERSRFGFDLEYRLGRLEEEGMVGEVLFPDAIISVSGVPFAGTFGAATNLPYEHRAAGLRAHNRWQADHVDPARQIGLVSLGYDDIDDAVEQVHWGRAAGLGGVLLEGINPKYPPLHDEYFDPLWAACDEESMPVHFHGGGGAARPPSIGARSDVADRDPRATYADAAIAACESGFFAHRPMWFMINGGVFDRHPGLKIVFVETGVLWAEHLLKVCDYNWEYMPGNGITERRPSEYYADHVFFGVSNPLSRWEIESRHSLGLGQIMWGGDHPHWGSPWGCTTEWLRVSFGATDVTEPDARKLLGENAAALYHLDLDELNSIAERVGPPVAEVLRRADPSDHDIPAIRVLEPHPGRL